MKYIDLHCDTFTELEGGETLANNHKNVDLESLQKGGCMLQCASIFIPTGTYAGADRKEAIQAEYDRVLSVYNRELNANKKTLHRVLTGRDIRLRTVVFLAGKCRNCIVRMKTACAL